MTRENESNDEVNIARLACFKNPYQFFFQAEFLNLEALVLTVFIAVILNLDR